MEGDRGRPSAGRRQVARPRGTPLRDQREVNMPDGIFSKTQAEVALDLVRSYLEFAGEEEREKYRDADSYFRLFERAYRLIIDVAEKGKPPTGFIKS